MILVVRERAVPEKHNSSSHSEYIWPRPIVRRRLGILNFHPNPISLMAFKSKRYSHWISMLIGSAGSKDKNRTFIAGALGHIIICTLHSCRTLAAVACSDQLPKRG
ncbi:hypothetical protein BDV39DRAFT_166765 [Aspergillus sergii]|uniref:Uncharacterized protein n=1 Tax=Aspergillus sergii TaxID=1034303 RepID=A0A5N6XMH2_9EURO|nr:hypothetical protein BDV39DRAFT_166765 [Aspergillus sergii]